MTNATSSIAGIATGALLAVVLLLNADRARAKDAAPGDQGTLLDEVLVTGVQPGPRLWKISSGQHVLWILGTYGPLPKKMSWRSAEVETIIAKSQVLLTAVDIKARVGFFTGLGLLPSLIGVRDNPQGAKLQQIVPAALYARWQLLKARYIGADNGIERRRPIFAALELYRQAIDQTGLQSGDVVWPVVEKLANRNRLRRVRPTLALEIAQPRAAIRQFKQSPLDDLECFARTIERLENDLDLMRARANAWAVGDIAALRRMTHVDQAGACIAAVMNSQLARERSMQQIPARVAAAWIEAAEAALAANAATFAVLPIEEIMKPDGYVATLQARGYTVQAP
jgi:hypothetical protein